MVIPSPVVTGPMQAEAFWNLEAGSESPRCSGDLKIGDRVSFVRPGALQGGRETELVVTLISKAYIYCECLQTGDIQLFNRQHHHVEGPGWLEPAREPLAAAEPLLLQGRSYPPCPFGDVLEAEAWQGRAVAVAIKHDGGWAVSSSIDEGKTDE